MSQLLVAPHNPSGPVATVATGHVVSTIKNFFILEYAWGEANWRADLLTPPEPIVDGFLSVSQSPGLGYTLNAGIIDQHRRANPSTDDSTKVVIEPKA